MQIFLHIVKNQTNKCKGKNSRTRESMLPIKFFFKGVAVKLAAFKLLQLALRWDWSHTAIQVHKMHIPVVSHCLTKTKQLKKTFDHNYGKWSTDFRNSFTVEFRRKVSMHLRYRLSPHLISVATLPCEIWKFKITTKLLLLHV